MPTAAHVALPFPSSMIDINNLHAPQENIQQFRGEANAPPIAGDCWMNRSKCRCHRQTPSANAILLNESYYLWQSWGKRDNTTMIKFLVSSISSTWVYFAVEGGRAKCAITCSGFSNQWVWNYAVALTLILLQNGERAHWNAHICLSGVVWIDRPAKTNSMMVHACQSFCA